MTWNDVDMYLGIGEQEDLVRFSGSQSEEDVRAAEESLGVRFPVDYRRFVSDWGYGGFGDFDVAGVGSESFDTMFNVVTMTREQRETIPGFPPGHVVISRLTRATGDILVCLDTATTQGDACVVVGCRATMGRLETVGEPLAGSFLEFLTDRMRLELHREGLWPPK
ncbi:MAG: SMI1/KNR4 family protein [Planctomycetota bacterium]